MKTKTILNTLLYSTFHFIILAFLVACNSDDDNALSENPSFSISEESIDFGNVAMGEHSEKELHFSVENSANPISIHIENEAYGLSLDGTDFSQQINLTPENSSEEKNLYIRFEPTEFGEANAEVALESDDFSTQNISITGNCEAQTHRFSTFENEHLAFGEGYNQSAENTFQLIENTEHTEAIKMFVKLDCPTAGCNEWDVFAHVQVQDPSSGEWYEMGRYITPYGVDNHQLEEGFEIDVTDFKSLLSGNVNLRTYIEVWGTDGWNVSVDFDYIEGTPDFQHYNISRVIQYNENSLEGVPYGVDAPDFDLTKTISVPENSESTHLRTVISGWGHATPLDTGGRPCAEWCFRTHEVLIDGSSEFQHVMEPIGCAENPVSPQYGNWEQERAGWCPGMAVPVRVDKLNTSMAGESVNFEYYFEPWEADGGNTSGQDGAFYAISTYAVVKSNSPIEKPTITE